LGVVLGGIWGWKSFSLSTYVEMAIMGQSEYWSRSIHNSVRWTIGFPYQFSTYILTSGEMEFHDNYLLAFLCWIMSISVGMFIGYLASKSIKMVIN